MSYLLEALRKSERERQEKTTVPDLQSPTVEWESAEESRNRSPWLTVAVLAICLNSLLLGVLVWRFGFADNGADSNAPTAIGTTPPLPSSAAVTAPGTAAVAATPPAVIVLQQPAAGSAAIVIRDRPPLPNRAPAARVTPSPRSEQDSRHSTSVPVAVDRPELQAVTRTATAATIGTDIPSVNALPLAIRQQLPLLTMNSHIYASNARDSFVMINGNSMSPGQEISAGLKLLAVVPEGALLEFNGQPFVLPALASFSP